MAPKSLKPPVQLTAASEGAQAQQHSPWESQKTSPVQETIQAIPHSGLHAPSTTVTTTTTTATAITTTTTSETHSLLIRPLQPSDEAALLRIWLEGWEDTIVQFAPVVWRKLAGIARLAAAALAATALCCAATFAARLPPRPVAPPLPPPAPVGLSPAPQLLPAVLLPHWLRSGSESVWAALALASPALVASLPGWVLALVAAAAALAAAPALVPPRLQLALLRVIAHRLIRWTCPDMWSMGGYWDRAAAGREYWVAQLQPGGRVVGGVALKVGAGVRPLAAAALNVKAGGGGAVLPGEPAEDEAGFTESDVRGHGPLEGGDALVYRMVTDKTVRRCGVGRRLMEAVMERAGAAGVRRVLLATANAEAIKFYRACGFEPRPPAVAGQGGGGSVLWRSVASERTSDGDSPGVKVD